MPKAKQFLKSVSDALPMRRNKKTFPAPYEELNPALQEIRIMELKPGIGNYPLVCTLMTVSLLSDPRPDYETISYVWGDSTKRGRIYMYGNLVDIPFSSETVLKWMRYPKKKRRLWMDAVCINQQDTVERGQQVSFMGDIYRNGHANLIWLGKDDLHTARVLADISSLAGEMRSQTNNFENVIEVVYDQGGRLQYSKTPLLTDIGNWTALKDFYEYPWFSRVWIVQEAALARSNICYRGSYEFPMDNVLRAAIWLRYKRYAFSRDILNWMHHAAMIADFADPLCGHRALFWEPKELQSLINALKASQASDPRDYVFGILGLAEQYGNAEPMPAALIPNYEARTADVFRDVVKLDIQQHGGLEMLGQVSRRLDDDFSSWPSWVPSWHRDDADHDPAGLIFPNFNADNRIDQPLPLEETHDADVLALRGLVTDLVSHVAPAVPPLPWKAIDAADTLREILDNARTTAIRACKDQDHAKIIGVLSCTLVTSTDVSRRRMSESECIKLYETWQQQALSRTDSTNTNGSSSSRSQGENDAREFYLAVRRFCSHRCVFSTKSGKLGLGPKTTQPGDLVAILYGSNLPFVLRSTQQEATEATHELVGSCYVHGIMDGEGVEAHRAAGKDDETFYLR